jgi:hypothetical protein
LLPILSSAKARDVFADPFDDAEPADLGPALVVLDDGSDDASVREARGRLTAAAQARGVRIETISTTAGSEVARYAALLATGQWAAAYLGIGLTPHR